MVSNPEQYETPAPTQYLVLSGEGVPLLSAAIIAKLASLATQWAGASIEAMIVVADSASVDTTAEQKPAPIPMTRIQMEDFALEHGIPKHRAIMAWANIGYTHDALLPKNRAGADIPLEYRDYPIRFLDSDNPGFKYRNGTLDVRSVYERLVGTELKRHAWQGSGLQPVRPYIMEFLIDLANEVVQPEEKLTYTSSR